MLQTSASLSCAPALLDSGHNLYKPIIYALALIYLNVTEPFVVKRQIWLKIIENVLKYSDYVFFEI